MMATVTNWNDVITECAKIGVGARYVDVGGGGECLWVPLSEDKLRFVWLGCDDDGDEPLWINFGPARFMGGCAYICANADGDDPRQVGLENAETDPADPVAVARTIRAMVTLAMAIPDEEYTSI